MQDLERLEITKTVDSLVNNSRKGIVAVHSREQALYGENYLKNLTTAKREESKNPKVEFPRIKFRVLPEDLRGITKVGTILSFL